MNMETTAIQKYETKGGQLLAEARSIMIVDDTTRELAAEFSTGTRKVIRVIEDEFKPDIEKAHQLHKGLIDRKNRLISPFKEAQGIVDAEIRRDYLEREKVRQAEAEAARMASERERRKQEAELAAQAAQCIEDGDMEEAEALLDSEVVVSPVVPIARIQQTTKSDAGSTTVKKDIEVEVRDKGVVIAAVTAGKLPDTLLDVNLGAAKRYARAAGLTTMPGFAITETAIVAGRVR